ncbi:MAG: DUF2934 domain-containing protein [Burkholderiaceae bacterium]|nr:DUF2934 domain-containing protein [Sulfuritalea sp.]MCF8176041.1 DUF2934 domain-containing protein [Burkholderiaceae bacterium]
MANTTKSVASPPGKRAAPKPVAAKPAKAKPATKVKSSAKPAVKVAVAPKVAKAAKSAKPTAEKPARLSRAKKAAPVTPDQRRYYVEVAAYHIAERRGFAPGDPLADWIEAEAEIDRLLAAGLLGG